MGCTKHKYRFIVTAGVVFVGVGILATIVARDIQRGQLLGRTMALMSQALSAYVQEHGAMPGGYEDLVASGILAGDEQSGYIVGGMRQRLYLHEDLDVAWGIDLAEVRLDMNTLVDRDSDEPVYLIRIKDPGLLHSRTAGMPSSVTIYKQTRLAEP